MKSINKRTPIVILPLLGLGVVVLLAVTNLSGQRVRSSSEKPAARAHLVHADDDFEQFLLDAKKLIDEKNYNRGIEILQALIRRNDSGFVAVDGSDGRQYVGLRLKATDMLGQLPPEGMQRYHALYDAQAKRYYEDALAGDYAQLRTLLYRYVHTSYGPKAMDMLAAVYFDQGRFSQAAATWRELLTVKALPAQQRPMILAKAAAAHHLAGETAESAKCAGELKAKYPDASGEVSGKNQKLLEFVAAIGQIKPETIGNVEVTLRDSYPGLGGIPDGAAIQDEAEVLLVPRWLVTADETGTLLDKDITKSLMAMSDMFKNPNLKNYGIAINAEMDKGLVKLRCMSNGRQNDFNLMAAIQPVVAGETVIYRNAEGMTAVDVITGKIVWKDSMPVVRDVPNISGYSGYWNGYIMVMDQGRYTLTVGGDKVFAVGNYRPFIHPNALADLQRQDQLKGKLGDTSTLKAVSIKSQGALRWEIGNGQGDDDMIKGGKFLCPPTYKDGRLYTILEFIDSFHLVCLDADSGKLIWKTTISQAPMMANPNYGWMWQQVDNDRAAPPAVADGRVYCVTNAGVVAAFDADSGQSLWAHQYEFRAPQNRSGSNVIVMPEALNPVIAASGRVICLPADSDQVLCLSAENGEPVWKDDVSRRDQSDLSYVDDKRILLSGPGLFVINLADGKELWGSANEEVVGRPSVNSKYALASGAGKLLKLNLASYNKDVLDLNSPDGLLGNLLCVDGKLMAANAAGLCAYFSYEQAFEKMTERLQDAVKRGDKGQQLDLTFQRGKLSFSAMKFAKAMEDMLEVKKSAAGQSNAEKAQEVRPWLYRTYVAVGNTDSNPNDALAHYMASEEYADSAQDKAHNLVRLTKYYLKAKDLKKALESAQALSETYSKESLFDVKIGAEADDTVRIPENAQFVLGKTLAQSLVAATVATPEGRQAYASFDATARAQFDKAKGEHDIAALAGVADRWPNSLAATAALFAAGEECYLQSADADDQKAATLVADGMRYLHEVANAPNAKDNVSANVGLALLWARSGRGDIGKLRLVQQQDLADEQEFSFAGKRGRIADLLKELDATAEPTTRPVAEVCRLNLPLEHKFTTAGSYVTILTDQNYKPVRVGDSVVVLKDQRIVLLDTQCKDPTKAEAWTGMSVTPEPQLRQFVGSPPSMRMIAGLSKDTKVIAVADRDGVIGLAMDTAKLTWKKDWASLGINGLNHMGVGEGVIVAADGTGKITCVDLAKGEVLWQSELTSPVRNLVAPPQICNGVVLARHNNGQALTCWSLETGKMIAGLESKVNQGADAMFTSSGLLVTLVDRQLSVFDPKENKAVWSAPKVYDKTAPLLMATSGDWILVNPNWGANDIEVLSVTSGGSVATFNAGQISNGGAVPFDGVIKGDVAYVTVCRQFRSGTPRVSAGYTSVGGVSVQAFDLKKKQMIWQADLDTDQDRTTLSMPLTVTDDSVIFTPYAIQSPQEGLKFGKVYVINAVSGKVSDVLDPSTVTGNAPVGGRPSVMQSPAVVTNNRLLMENIEGVCVHGGQ